LVDIWEVLRYISGCPLKASSNYWMKELFTFGLEAF